MEVNRYKRLYNS